ncbi:hypothetical protein BHE74_00044461 [Ensete ventricosum]|nr:hypothetical protein BHE74_00044461 [Ensete ventricosum]
MPVLIKVCNFDLYRPVWAVHIGPTGYRYTNHPLSGGTIKNRPLAVDFGHRWSIEGEIDRRQSISTVGSRLREKLTVGDRLREKKGRRGKEEEEKKSYPHAVLATRGSFARCRRPRPRALFLPRKEMERLPAQGERSRRPVYTV